MRVFPVYTDHFRLPGPSVHAFLPPPAPVPGPVFPAPAPACCHVEIPHRVHLAVAGKFAESVRFDRFRIALDGHDTGALIPHIGLPPNAGMILTILTSKYKLLFTAKKIQAEGSALATYFPLLAPPQFCCTPCSLPAFVPPMNNVIPFPNTVGVGMTLDDFLSGWGNVLAESLVDLVFTFLFAGRSPFASGAREIAKMATLTTTKALALAFAKAGWAQLTEDAVKEIFLGLVKLLQSDDVKHLDLPFTGWRVRAKHGRGLEVGPPGNPTYVEGPSAPLRPATTATGLTPPAGTPAAL